MPQSIPPMGENPSPTIGAFGFGGTANPTFGNMHHSGVSPTSSLNNMYLVVYFCGPAMMSTPFPGNFDTLVDVFSLTQNVVSFMLASPSVWELGTSSVNPTAVRNQDKNTIFSLNCTVLRDSAIFGNAASRFQGILIIESQNPLEITETVFLQAGDETTFQIIKSQKIQTVSSPFSNPGAVGGGSSPFNGGNPFNGGSNNNNGGSNNFNPWGNNLGGVNNNPLGGGSPFNGGSRFGESNPLNGGSNPFNGGSNNFNGGNNLPGSNTVGGGGNPLNGGSNNFNGGGNNFIPFGMGGNNPMMGGPFNR